MVLKSLNAHFFVLNGWRYKILPLNYFYFLLVRLRVPIGCTTELNHLGHRFLQRLFDKYDEVSSYPAAFCFSGSPDCWLTTVAYLTVVLLFWWSNLLCRRTKTLPCHRPSLGICFVCVPTCHGVQRSTWLSHWLKKDTSLTSATAVSGRTCLTWLWMSFVWSWACTTFTLLCT